MRRQRSRQGGRVTEKEQAKAIIYDFIEGPISLAEYKIPQYEKHIYIFGDRHDRDGHCVRDGKNDKSIATFKEFMLSMIDANPEKVLDFYLEYPHLSKKRDVRYKLNPKQAYLQEIRHDFQDCFHKPKYECLFKNVRVHYIDVRDAQYNPTFERIHELGETLRDALSVDSVRDAIQDIVENYRFDQVLTSKDGRVLRKQWDKVEDGLLASKIYRFFSEKSDEHLLRLEILMKHPMPMRMTEEIQMAFLGYNGQFMDFYLMCRLFRHFRDVPGSYSRRPKYIIIYAGNNHANNYGLFLKQELQSKPIAYELTDDQCLDIEAFDQPFFHSSET